MVVVEKALNISKVWLRFTKTSKDGKTLKFRWEQLPKHRFEEFIDFKMNNYVKHEFMHYFAGIFQNSEATKEFRQIISEKYKKPSHSNLICCVDDDEGKIVAFDSTKLYKKGDILEYYEQAKTAEVRLFYKMVRTWDKLYPLSDVLSKYNVNAIMDDAGTAVHPDFRGYRFTNEIGYLRENITKSNAVQLLGAWMTSAAIQKASENQGWKTVYEIDYELSEKLLGIKLLNAPHKIVYKIKKIE